MKSSARRKIIQDDEQKRTFSSRAAFLWENIYPAVFAGLGTMPSNRENRFSLTASMVRENRKKKSVKNVTQENRLAIVPWVRKILFPISKSTGHYCQKAHTIYLIMEPAETRSVPNTEN